MLKPRKRLTKRQIKEDKLVTYYFKTVDYINKNSKLVSTILIGILAVVALTILISRSKKNAETNAALELTKARVQMSTNNNEMAIDILKSTIKNYGGTSSAGRGVFYLANIYFEQGNLDEAYTYYKKYIDDYGDDIILASSAYSGMGACLEEKQEYLKAAKSYFEGAKKYAKHFEAPQQLINAARCYRLSNNKAEAIKMYNKIIDEYPKSKLKMSAELYLNKLQG